MKHDVDYVRMLTSQSSDITHLLNRRSRTELKAKQFTRVEVENETILVGTRMRRYGKARSQRRSFFSAFRTVMLILNEVTQLELRCSEIFGLPKIDLWELGVFV